MSPLETEQRRLLLKFLLGSPLLALGACASPEEKKVAVDSILDGIIKNPSEALNVFDFEKASP